MRTPTTLIPVKDCMSRQFVSVRADTPVVEATTARVGNALLGGPVLDADGRLIGWVSEHDCLNVVLQVAYYSERVATVGDIMRRDVLTADPEGSALDLANAMQQQYGVAPGDTLAGIRRAFDHEFAAPTSDVEGGFQAGHS